MFALVRKKKRSSLFMLFVVASSRQSQSNIQFERVLHKKKEEKFSHHFLQKQ